VPECVEDPNAKSEEIIKGCNHYCFAQFLDPGYHQLIIYDPQTEQAFCQELVIDINYQQVLFPELP